MIKIKLSRFVFFLLFFHLGFTAQLEPKDYGDLTKQKPISKLVLLKGKNGKQHNFSPNVLSFQTGRLYKLEIKNVSDSKHYFSSSKFSKSIFTRKIQINKNDKKIAEVKGNIFEIEVFPNNTVEWWFIPIKTGIFEDLSCSVKDKITDKVHSKMGMVGKIIIR